MEAVDVLPYRSRLTTNFSIGNLSPRAAASMMRILAWCGTMHWTWSSVSPAASTASFVEEAITRVAKRKTSRPSMWMKCSPAWMVASAAGWRLPPAGTDSRSPPEPSERITAESTPPGRSLACSTKAPAPSPNRMQVLRSFQLTKRESVSVPITNAVLIDPLRMDWAAILRA